MESYRMRQGIRYHLHLWLFGYDMHSLLSLQNIRMMAKNLCLFIIFGIYLELVVTWVPTLAWKSSTPLWIKMVLLNSGCKYFFHGIENDLWNLIGFPIPRSDCKVSHRWSERCFPIVWHLFAWRIDRSTSASCGAFVSGNVSYSCKIK